MSTPLVAARLREGQLKGSPIREIMKLADRRNIVALGLDPDDVISFAGGWVNHPAPDGLRAEYANIANDPKLFHELGAYSPTRGLPKLRDMLLRFDEALYGTEGLRDEHLIVGHSSTGMTHAPVHGAPRPLATACSCSILPTRTTGPSWTSAPEGLEILRLTVLDTDSWSFMPNPDRVLGELERVLREDQPRLMLFSSPDNPTSQIVPGRRVLPDPRDGGPGRLLRRGGLRLSGPVLRGSRAGPARRQPQ